MVPEDQQYCTGTYDAQGEEDRILPATPALSRRCVASSIRRHRVSALLQWSHNLAIECERGTGFQSRLGHRQFGRPCDHIVEHPSRKGADPGRPRTAGSRNDLLSAAAGNLDKRRYSRGAAGGPSALRTDLAHGIGRCLGGPGASLALRHLPSSARLSRRAGAAIARIGLGRSPSHGGLVDSISAASSTARSHSLSTSWSPMSCIL